MLCQLQHVIKIRTKVNLGVRFKLSFDRLFQFTSLYCHISLLKPQWLNSMLEVLCRWCRYVQPEGRSVSIFMVRQPKKERSASETSVTIHHLSPRNIPEGLNLRQHRCENLKFRGRIKHSKWRN